MRLATSRPVRGGRDQLGQTVRKDPDRDSRAARRLGLMAVRSEGARMRSSVATTGQNRVGEMGWRWPGG